MVNEVAFIITLVSVGFAVFSGVVNLKRNARHDTKNDASELTTVIVKLENIGTGIAEIKSEMKNVKDDVKETREKIIRIEESLKSAWKRIEVIEGSKKKLGDKTD